MNHEDEHRKISIHSGSSDTAFENDKMDVIVIDAAIDSCLDTYSNECEDKSKLNSKREKSESSKKKGLIFLRKNTLLDSSKVIMSQNSSTTKKTRNGKIKGFIDNKFRKVTSNKSLASSPLANIQRRRRSTSMTKFLRRKSSSKSGSNTTLQVNSGGESIAVRKRSVNHEAASANKSDFQNYSASKEVENNVKKYRSLKKVQSVAKTIDSPNIAKVDAILSNEASNIEDFNRFKSNTPEDVVGRIFSSRSGSFVPPKTITTTLNDDEITVDSLTPHSENQLETTFYYDPLISNDNPKGPDSGISRGFELFKNSPLPRSPTTTLNMEFGNAIKKELPFCHEKQIYPSIGHCSSAKEVPLQTTFCTKEFNRISHEDDNVATFCFDDDGTLSSEQEYVDDIKNLMVHKATKSLQILFFVIIFFGMIVVLGLVQIGLTAPIHPGDVIYPGEKFTRCGLLDLLPDSWVMCDPALLTYEKNGNSWLLLNRNGVVWEMKPAEDNHLGFQPKLQFLEDKTILIGGKKATRVVIGMPMLGISSNNTFVRVDNLNNDVKNFAPWPFLVEPQGIESVSNS